MRVLLLHPEDDFPLPGSPPGWDLVVDLGRAPTATYERWSAGSDGRVISLYDFADEARDACHLKELLRQGMGYVVDRYGIDWWDVVSPMILPEIQKAVLLLRLTQKLGSSCQLYCSRPDASASAVQKFLGVECRCLQKGYTSVVRRAVHYRKALSRLDFSQIAQITQDKFDPEHSLRRRFGRRRSATGNPVFLLPSAYINVSRTAVSYASLLPEEDFLLVTARRGGRLHPLPANVRMVSLDAYFGPLDRAEISSLLEKWSDLQRHLVSTVPEFRLAEAVGMFGNVPWLMRWGVAARDAWNRVFESGNIAGCLSADDANPYTGIPLLLAKKRGLPALAVHHGALDYRMAVKTLHADLYLAKGELERDYLVHECHMDPERIAMGSPARSLPSVSSSEDRPWLVFFTEPYGTAGWRMEEVYRDLLPRLCSLAQDCGLKLIFKLHPFESVKGHRNLLRKYLSKNQLREIQVLAGPTSAELWRKTRFAMTVESTIALECATLGIPVFLCAWLQSAYGGYVQQYAKFGVGHVLDSSAQISDVPRLLAQWKKFHPADKIWRPIEPRELRSLLTGTYQYQARALA